MDLTTNPSFVPVFKLPENNPYAGMFQKIADVYGKSMQASVLEYWATSAQIIQEHLIKAFVASAQQCAEALTKNATQVQAASIERLADANKEVVEIMNQPVDEPIAAVPETIAVPAKHE